MPLDGDPEDVENTGISIHDITDYLRHCNVGNVVLILDACRSQGIKGEGIGRQTETEVRSTGIISIFLVSLISHHTRLIRFSKELLLLLF